jgi:hypothetical protein
VQSIASLVQSAGRKGGAANAQRGQPTTRHVDQPVWGCLLQDSSDLGRGVNEGISANAMHHNSAAMIAGYQNNIGMTDLLCQKTPTADQSSRQITAGWSELAPNQMIRGETLRIRPFIREVLERFPRM